MSQANRQHSHFAINLVLDDNQAASLAPLVSRLIGAIQLLGLFAQSLFAQGLWHQKATVERQTDLAIPLTHLG